MQILYYLHFYSLIISQQIDFCNTFLTFFLKKCIIKCDKTKKRGYL